jgi:cytochrome c-type biogenesis protein CcmE
MSDDNRHIFRRYVHYQLAAPLGKLEGMRKIPIKIVAAAILVIATVSWLAYTGVRDTKSYYVTITELNSMGNKAYTRNLRVAGNVAPGSIERTGANAQFVLIEQGKQLRVNYEGAEPPPDTFKDDAQALAVGTYGRDGVFHATQLQAKCASKYAPAKPGQAPSGNTAMLAPGSAK